MKVLMVEPGTEPYEKELNGLKEGLVFGYFDYKAYFYSDYREEKIQDLFMKKPVSECR